jgi:hypothetical protein
VSGVAGSWSRITAFNSDQGQNLRRAKLCFLLQCIMTALASRQEFQTHKPRLAPAPQVLIKKECPAPNPFPQPHEFPLVCEKTQCIICIGNEQLPYKQRTRTFRRVSHMMDHVENLHLSKLRSMGSVERRASSREPRLKSLVLESLVGPRDLTLGNSVPYRNPNSALDSTFGYTFSYYSAPRESERLLRNRG